LQSLILIKVGIRLMLMAKIYPIILFCGWILILMLSMHQLIAQDFII